MAMTRFCFWLWSSPWWTAGAFGLGLKLLCRVLQLSGVDCRTQSKVSSCHQHFDLKTAHMWKYTHVVTHMQKHVEPNTYKHRNTKWSQISCHTPFSDEASRDGIRQKHVVHTNINTCSHVAATVQVIPLLLQYFYRSTYHRGLALKQLMGSGSRDW